MSRYGLARYGVDLYGPDAGLGSTTDFVTTLNAQSGGFLRMVADQHNTITLSWMVPTGAWDKMRLVRNRYGIPADEQDGVVLSESLKASAVSSYQDEDLAPSTFYYYAVYVRATRGDGSYVWLRAAAVRGLSVGDNRSTETLETRLPRILTSTRSATGVVDPAEPMTKFLGILGFSLDAYKDRISALLDVNAPSLVPGEVLPALMQRFGYAYEPTIGMVNNRNILRNATYLTKYKATNLGVVALGESVTGWVTSVKPFLNLLRSTDDSSAVSTVGNWVKVSGANATLARVSTPSIDATGALRVTTTATNTVVLSLEGTSGLKTGIKITPGTTYVFSIATKNASGFSPTIGGLFLGEGAGGTVGSTTNAADPVDATWTRYTATVTATGPHSVVFVPRVTLTGVTSGTNVYLDEAVFAQGTSFSSYVTPRRLEIYLRADRINEAVNGGFDVDTNSWTAAGGTFTRDTGIAYDGGVASGKLAGTSASSSLSTSCNMTAGRQYVVAYQAETSSATAQTGLTVTFRDSSNAVISTFTTPVTESVTTTWSRHSAVFTTPANTTHADVQINYAGSGLTIYTDDVLVELGSQVRDYFDRKTQRDNVFYEGTVSASRLHYYRNRVPRQSRFEGLLSSALPLGASYLLHFGSPLA